MGGVLQMDKFMNKYIKVLLLTFFLAVISLAIDNTVYAGHNVGTAGFYCDGGQIWEDASNGLHYFSGIDCKNINNSICVSSPNRPFNAKAECISKLDSSVECELSFLRNECTGCGIARSVAQNTCTGTTSILLENVRDSGCNNAQWCPNNVVIPTVTPTIIPQATSTCTIITLRNECTGCGIARTIGQNTCTNVTSIIKENVNNSGCNNAQWCAVFPSPTIAPITKSPLICTDSLPFGDLGQLIDNTQQAAGLPVWITEIGAGTDNQQWQAEYLKRVLRVSPQKNVLVTIWYGWKDNLLGDDGKPHWGLYNIDNTIKSTGIAFTGFTQANTSNNPVYQMFIDCFKEKANTVSCPDKNAVDYNHDGNVDEQDYKLFIQSFGQ